MQKIPIQPDLSLFPEAFHSLLDGCAVWDSSCSQNAHVYFIEKDGGLFLKSAPNGSLSQEAQMAAFFHSKDLGPEVLSYRSLEQDWLLTRRIPGEDCTHAAYLDQPEKLCDSISAFLRNLHDQPHSGCPVTNCTAQRLNAAQVSHQLRHWDASLLPGIWQFDSPEEAWEIMESNRHWLKTDTLLHGDYCLPNIMMDNWQFTGFLDVGGGGIGDRHFDLFWGIWSLSYNLKTCRYTDRFLDGYGRETVEPEILRLVAAIEAFA